MVEFLIMAKEKQLDLKDLQSLELFHLQETFADNLGIHGREIVEGFFKKNPELTRENITPQQVAKV